MKSLIKKGETMGFLTEDGSWIRNVSKARVFSRVTAVHEEKNKQGLKNVEHYVLQRDEVSFSISVSHLDDLKATGD